MSEKTVKRRLVFHVGGYEPVSAEAVFRRVERELPRFCATWNITARLEQPAWPAADRCPGGRIVTQAPDWQVETGFHLLAWDDIVLADFARPTWLRLALGLKTFFDLLLSGTAFRYVLHAWRFALYFLYPFTLAAAFILLGLTAGHVVSRTGLTWIAGAPVAALVIWALFRWPGRRWFVPHLLDLWIFSIQFLHGRRPDAEARLDDWAKRIAALAENERPDEILLIGHSTGGVLILDLADRLQRANQRLTEDGPEISILTIGSTALKVGLHPSGRPFRAAVARLASIPRLHWVDYQSRADIINFYNTDPARLMRLRPERPDPFPLVQRVRIGAMVGEEFYRRIRKNFFRLHYQFVMGNTQRYHYDYLMFCCGPHFAWARALAPQDTAGRFAEDGSLGPTVEQPTVARSAGA